MAHVTNEHTTTDPAIAARNGWREVAWNIRATNRRGHEAFAYRFTDKDKALDQWESLVRSENRASSEGRYSLDLDFYAEFGPDLTPIPVTAEFAETIRRAISQEVQS